MSMAGDVLRVDKMTMKGCANFATFSSKIGTGLGVEKGNIR